MQGILDGLQALGLNWFDTQKALELSDSGGRYTTYKGFDVIEEDGSVGSTVWVSMEIDEQGEEIDLEYHDEPEDAGTFAFDHAQQRDIPYIKGGMDVRGRTFS